MEWDKIWANNKKVIDPIVPRYCAIGEDTCVKLHIQNGPEKTEYRKQPLHPKDASVGEKDTAYGRELWIERDDANEIAEGEKITLMKWGNATVHKKETIDGKTVLTATIDENDKDFKKTKKITWLCSSAEAVSTVKLIEFEHLIDKEKIEEDDDVEKLVNKYSKHVQTAISEIDVSKLKKGDIFQFERRGFYIVDKEATGSEPAECIFIPDGKSKAMSSITHAVDAAEI